jgi:uncharacterized Tic20 family protein
MNRRKDGQMDGQMNERNRFVVEGVTDDERTYTTFIHLSLIAHSILPVIAFAVPLVMWLVKKDESAYINDHGREAVNFQISLGIYNIIFSVLIFLLVGIPLLIALQIFSIVVMILAAIAANRGELYRYPMTIRFLNA